MPYTERSKPQVILNKMTKAVYDSTEKDPDQLYAITDINASVERELTQAEYNALSNADKMNGTTYYITDASNKQNDVYSTSEQPVGTWVDGKTIYRKTVAFGALPKSTSKKVAHGISNLDYVLKFEGTCLQGAGYKNIPLMYKGSDATYNVEFSVDGTHIEAVSNQDRSFVTCPYITIYYTKN